VLKNSFRGISRTKFARKSLNLRLPLALKFTEITALVPFSTATGFIASCVTLRCSLTLYGILETFANFLLNQVAAKEAHNAEPNGAGDSNDQNPSCGFWHGTRRQ